MTIKNFSYHAFAFLLLATALHVEASASRDLQEGLVLSNPAVLRELENKGFGLADLISVRSDLGVQSNAQLAALPTFQPIIENMQKEVSDFKTKHPKSGVGLQFGERLFDLSYLTNARARFVLVGIINRLDQAYKDSNHCGETRFIYRLVYNVVDKGNPMMSRMPMTVNLLFNAGRDGSRATCAEIAKSWQQVSAKTTADEMTSLGPLRSSLFERAQIRQLEINLQIVRLPASSAPGFGGHAEYLLKVYRWTGATFSEAVLENQIDRERLAKDPELLAELKAWLTDPRNTKAIDQGTHLIPEKFLARRALSIAPGGITRSANRPFFSLLSPSDLAKISFDGLEQVKSPMGFLRRLNDSSCIGCHQSRAIGGFHFTGRDPFGKYPGNSVYLPGSAHFMGDLTRRKEILQQFASGAGDVDMSRGFSERPQERRAKELLGSGLLNGWGAHCSSGNDPSFKGWTCAEGLTCKSLLDKQDGLGNGICLSQTHQEVGDPCESGRIETSSYGVDKYKRTAILLEVKDKNTMCSPQSQAPGTKTGGFLNGSVRKLTCDNLPSEAVCGPLPAARPGFNACIGKKTFTQCLKEFSLGVGLRGCDQLSPCRDDYICAESFDPTRGSCVPPYFLVQFRVDGHPRGEKSAE